MATALIPPSVLLAQAPVLALTIRVRFWVIIKSYYLVLRDLPLSFLFATLFSTIGPARCLPMASFIPVFIIVFIIVSLLSSLLSSPLLSSIITWVARPLAWDLGALAFAPLFYSCLMIDSQHLFGLSLFFMCPSACLSHAV